MYICNKHAGLLPDMLGKIKKKTQNKLVFPLLFARSTAQSVHNNESIVFH